MREDEDEIRRRLLALGDDIEARWSAENYAEGTFPALAADALQRASIPDTIGLGDILRWSLETTRLPAQRDLPSRFGDPAITLYAGPRFCVEVYVWFTGTTALHQHGFAGAFQLLQGASIHGHYSFETTREVNPYLRFGHLHLEGCEMLEAGAVQEIQPGAAYIHRLYHLDHPSATLIVRTLTSPGHQPQFSYLPPSVAIDPFFEEPTATKRLQCLRALYRAHDPSADDIAASWLSRADLHTTFLILSLVRPLLGRNEVERVFGVAGNDDRFRRLVDTARTRHGDAIDHLLATFVEQERLDQLVALRGSVTDAEHRFFLALLLNVDDLDGILALVRHRFPDADARQKVLDWTAALARTRVMGSALPNALGVAGIDDLDLMILEQLLADATDDAIVATMADGAAPSEALTRQVETRLAKLRGAPVLRPLLRRRAA